MQRLACSVAIGAVALALIHPAIARANGRTPASVDVFFRPGSSQDVFFETTFGLLISHDDGKTFQFVCQDALPYSGTYDPSFAVAKGGDIYATTDGNASSPSGLVVSKDNGCTWGYVGSLLKGNDVAQITIGSDGRIWAVTGNGSKPNDIYVSTDGKTFASAGQSTQAGTWYQSVAVAPSDPDRLYVTGYIVMGSGGNPEALLLRSEDGGTTWKTLDVSAFSFGDAPNLYVVGVSPTNPDVVFARVARAYAAGSSADAATPAYADAIYRSSDAGATWTKVLEMKGSITAFVAEKDGNTIIAGTKKAGVEISTDGGKTFSDQVGQLPMACVGQRSDGTLFACGNNYKPDGSIDKNGPGALARSTDAQSWNHVLTFDQIAGPLDCQAGTVQYNTCQLRVWPTRCVQLGANCIAGPDAGVLTDAGSSHSGGGSHGCGGCSISLGAVLLVLPWRRRRRRSRRARV